MWLLVLPSYLGALWWIVGFGLLCMTSIGALLQPYVQQRRATNKEQPPLSAILPVKLENPGFEAAEASIFGQAYPEYEVLFAAAEATSPALDIVAKLKSDHPDVPVRIMQSQYDFAVSPKLNTLATPLSCAAHDLTFTKDSNIILAPDTLAAFVQNLAPGVGLVVGVPIAEQADGLAGHIEAFLINGHARLLLTASAFGLGFGVGKVMLLKRSDLTRAGGVEAMAYTLAEDTAIAKGFAEMGLKTVFAHQTLRQFIGRRSLREIFDRQLRWGVIRRAHEPLTFPLEPIANPLPAALAAALAAPLVGLAALPAFALTLGLWFGIEICVAWLKGWEISRYAPLAFIGREILALAAWLRAWTTDDVTWADGRFDVFNGAQSHEAATAPSKTASAEAARTETGKA